MKLIRLITKLIIINFVLLAITNGQVLTERPPSKKQNVSSGNPDSTTVINQEPKRSDQPFLGTDVPIFNPGTEVFSWDGQNWNINNNRLMRARFEKYLNTPADESEGDKEYREVLKNIIDSLSPHKRGKNHLQNAIALLPRASNYRIDSNLCDSLSQAILGVYYGQKNSVALAEQNSALNKERKLLNWNVEVATSESLIDKAREEIQITKIQINSKTRVKRYPIRVELLVTYNG